MFILSESLWLSCMYAYIQLYWELQCPKSKVKNIHKTSNFCFISFIMSSKIWYSVKKYENQTKTENKEVKWILASKFLLNSSVKLEDLSLNELTAHHQRHFSNRFFSQHWQLSLPFLPLSFPSFLLFFFKSNLRTLMWSSLIASIMGLRHRCMDKAV